MIKQYLIIKQTYMNILKNITYHQYQKIRIIVFYMKNKYQSMILSLVFYLLLE